MRIRFIGNIDAFEPTLREGMLKAMDHTQGNTALNMNVAVNYGGRWDIAQAAQAAAEAVARGEIAAEAINEAWLGQHRAWPTRPRWTSSSVPAANTA